MRLHSDSLPDMAVPSHNPQRTVSVSTLGCKLNQYESEAILAQFRQAGYAITDSVEAADVCVVNTCAVTAIAERKARSMLRSLHRKNPQAALLAVGCMAERSSAALVQIDGVNAVLGNREKEHILDFLPSASQTEAEVHIGETERAESFFGEGLAVEGLLGRTRAFLKVQDGCSQKCTYCIIPQLRGRGRSLEIPKVVEQAQQLADHGFAEIVITGVALGTYGGDLGLEDGMAKLLAALESVKGVQRIRLGSIEPWAVTDRFLKTVANSSVICPHLHIPLQSAEDFILHRMNRRYTVAEIEWIFEQAFALRSDWGFGSDIIVGFPGETEEHFGRTREFLAHSPIAYLHVFPYSSRPGTPATRLPGSVPDSDKHERVDALKTVDSALRLQFRNKFLNTTQRVLFEKRRHGDLLAGHAANYLDVYADVPESVAGSVVDMMITSLHSDGVVGELVNQG
ncbi:MAG TPA: tRNA (N(6)-L-threonylcarbamoyladenosine(37)-C(2))-methylthiotransferase MtaB [bacterium]